MLNLQDIQSKYIPEYFHSSQVQEIYRVPYQHRALEAERWAKEHCIKPANIDKKKIGLLLIDVQNTFCLPDFELYVGGASGMGAVKDNIRLCEFIYRNLGIITEIIPTMDSHRAMQIFHPIFWLNEVGEHPAPATIITLNDLQQGRWFVNPAIANSLSNSNISQLEQYALHYVQSLRNENKYPLTIWPYHAMLGGIGHALVSAVEEAVFFHSIARQSLTNFELKGNNPLTENYSVLRPEILHSNDGKVIAHKNTNLIQKLLNFDALYIAGQAKSHCVAWTVENLLTEIKHIDINLAKKIYLLEDCMSPVVIPGVVDFSIQADQAMEKFEAEGMHLVKSTEVMITG